jgi:hypothetical protein
MTFYVLLFGVVYLASCYFAMDPTKEQHQILCNSQKKFDGDPGLGGVHRCLNGMPGSGQSQEHAHNFL